MKGVVHPFLFARFKHFHLKCVHLFAAELTEGGFFLVTGPMIFGP